MQDDPFEPLWGAKAIAAYAEIPLRRAYYLLENGLLPARKIGASYASTKAEIRGAISGRRPSADEDKAGIKRADAA